MRVQRNVTGSTDSLDASAGVIPRSAKYLFQAIDSLTSGQLGVSVRVVVTYCEVYNEQVGTLATPPSNVRTVYLSTA